MNWISRLLNVPSTDPDDARRRKLLNILLAGILPLTFLLWLATFVADVTDMYPTNVLYLALGVWSLGIMAVFLLNRHGPGWLASMLFVLLLAGVVVFSDEPQEVAGGRALLGFAIPIVAASVLVRPYASFIMAGVTGVIIAVIGLRMQIGLDPFPMITYFVVALVSWLAAHTMERAIRDLRTLNLELDQRVQDRTRDLAEALSRNQAILEGIADGVIVFDLDGKARVVNPAIADLLERSPDEIMKRDIETLMGQDVDAADREMIAHLLRDRELAHPSVKLQWGDKTLSISFAPVRDASEGVAGTVAVFRDFTREAEVDRMKSTFLSIASHELRTPLNAILGYTDMLHEGVYGPFTDKQSDVIERVMANTGQMVNLVNDLLDQARIEAGKLSLNVASFALADLLDGVQDVMGVLAQAKGLELTSHVADDMPATLSGDRQRLHQILVNLASNAIKFTEQGTVHVRAYRPDAAHWALEVSDTGRGIPSEAQSHIFDPFEQVDGSVTREHTGFGLGLSIAKQLVTLMGGEITLASKVGRGSTFTVVLPLAPTQEGAL